MEKQVSEFFQEICSNNESVNEFECCDNNIFIFTIGETEYNFCKGHLVHCLRLLREKIRVIEFIKIVMFIFENIFVNINKRPFQKLLCFEILFCYKRMENLGNTKIIRENLNAMRSNYKRNKEKFGQIKKSYLLAIYEPRPFLGDINKLPNRVPKLFNLCKYKYTYLCSWNGILE